MKRTVIFGGSFDPLHIGHENIIRNLADRFDEVIVVPTYVSPFKQAEKAASPELRLAMLRSANFPDNVIISDYEIGNSGCSYSINTVMNFASEDRKLYFAVGGEAVRTLDKWYQAEKLKRMCVFYAILRPGYDKRRDVENVVWADFCGDDISSSEVKAALGIGYGKSLVSPGVYKIIEENGLYDGYSFVGKAYERFGMKPQRIEHSFNATVEGIKLAKRYDANIKDVTVALLMHDIGKYVTVDMLKNMKIPVPDCGNLPEECRHAEYGAAICKYVYKLSDEIVNAVKYHTTCCPSMDKLTKIVALADFIEPGRKFDGVEKIREAAKNNLDEAVVMMLKSTIDYLRAQNKYVAPITIETYRELGGKL